MEVVIIPPLTDLTIEPAGLGRPDRITLDLNKRFIRRLTSPAAVASLARTFDKPLSEPGDGLRGLFLAGAAQLLARRRADWVRMRAIGTALRLSTQADIGLHVALDDLTLRSGSTERSQDILAALAQTSLFDAEVRYAARNLRSSKASVAVDVDQQLPFAAALIRSMPAVRWRVLGSFAAAHHEALQRSGLLGNACIDDLPTPGTRIRSGWLPGREPISWATNPGEVPLGKTWAGWMDPAEAALLDPQRLRQCAGLTVTVMQIACWPVVMGERRVAADLTTVATALPPIAPLSVELLVEAADLAQHQLSQELLALARPDATPRLAGLRPLRRRYAPGTADPGGRDLPRWETPDPGPQTRTAAATLLADLPPDTQTYPARLAACAATRDVPRNRHGWDPCAAVVGSAHAGPDDKGPGTFIVNLRTGRALRVPSALAIPVRHLAAGQPGALDSVGLVHRQSVLDKLMRAGVIGGRS